MGHEYSLADIAAANGGMNSEMWNNPFIYLVWLAVLGGGGLFGNRWRWCRPLQYRVRLLAPTSSKVSTLRTSMLNFVALPMACDGFYAVNTGMKDGYGIKDAICGTNRNIDSVKYDLYCYSCRGRSYAHSSTQIPFRNSVIDLKHATETLWFVTSS